MEIVTCKVEGCVRAVGVKKWQLCVSHYNRWKYAGNFDLVVPLPLCKGCGTNPPLPSANVGPPPEYCGPACKSEASRARHIDSGKYSETLRRNREKAAASPLPVRECVMCGGSFESRRKRRFCLKSCKNKWARTVGSKPCSVEGCVLPLVATGLCHTHYKRKARAEGREVQQPWNDRRRAHWQERYALKRGAVGSETLVAADVFERDGWVCGICGERIDSAVSYPDPLSVSLDHIIPLSNGGGHVLANVQASHLVCNVRKGNRVESARR